MLRMHGIEEGLQKMVETRNRDMQNVTKALVMTDGHVYTINRILRDMVKGTVHYSEAYQTWQAQNPDVTYPREDVFDLPYYFGEFNKMQERLRQEQMAAQEKTDGKAANEDAGEADQGNEQGSGEGGEQGGDAQDRVPPVRQPAEAGDGQ
jgi:hypothetical protein